MFTSLVAFATAVAALSTPADAATPHHRRHNHPERRDQVVNHGAHGFGVGVVIGEPTGLTVAVRPNDFNAFQADVSWSILNDRFRVSADYLQSVAVIQPSPRIDVPFYVGLGLTVGEDGSPPWEDTPWVGARIPFGLTMLPEHAPIEVFGEVAPVAYALPEVAIGVEGALGARVYF